MENYLIENKIQEEYNEKKYFDFHKDRLKKQSFVYSSAPLVSKSSIDMNDLRSFVYADVYSRYLTYKGFNTLYSTTINNTNKSLYDNITSKVLSKDDPYSELIENSYRDLYSVDIWYDKEKTIDTHNVDFIHFIQDAFLKLYKQNYIIKDDVYFLDFNDVKEEVIKQLIESDMFDSLKDYLNYESGLVYKLKTTNNIPLEIFIKDPELLGGVNFICIKGNSPIAKKYFMFEEREYIIESLKKKKSIGVFSGNYCYNPLTNQEIPIIISNFFKEEIRVGNPNINDQDLLFSSVLGIEYNQIFNTEDGEKTLINSDYLDGLNISNARKVFIDNSLNDNAVTYYEDISKTKIQISEIYENGISLPCFIDDIIDNENLPILIDRKNKVRTINHKLSDKEITDQIFNTNITQAFLSIASRVKSKFGITKLSSLEFFNDLKDFPSIEYAIFNNKVEYLYTLILNIIILKNLEIKVNPICKFYIEGNFYDKLGLEILRSNNNLIDTNSIVRNHGACALRYSMLSTKIRDNFYYNLEELNLINNFINEFKQIYSYTFISENKDLDKMYKSLVLECTYALEENNLPYYINLLINFVNEVNKNKKIAFRQAKGLLILFSLITPSICEHINKVSFKANYPLMYEAWPI